jgi:hypothetical protein
VLKESGMTVSAGGSAKLKMNAWVEEEEPAWDDEIAFDESPKQAEVERARGLLHQEIITLLNKINMADPEASHEACDKLNEIFRAAPQEAEVLVQPSLAMPFLQHMLNNDLPIFSLLELLRRCVTLASSPKKQQQQASATAVSILRVINTACNATDGVLVVVCSLQGVALIAECTRQTHSNEMRVAAAEFLLILATKNGSLLQATSGLEAIASLLLGPYSTSRELCHTAIDCLQSLVAKQIPLARAPLCHNLMGFGIAEHLANLMHAIITGKEGIDETHLGRAIETLLALAAVSYTPFRRSICAKPVLEKIMALLKILRQTLTKSKALTSFLLNLLKVVHHASSEESVGDLLEPVIDYLIPLLGQEDQTSAGTPGVGGSRRTAIEINNQVMHILYNLCSLSPSRAARAAHAGYVPIIHRAVKESWPMRELALPILFNLLRMAPKVRPLLWETGTLQLFLDLLEDATWFMEACDCISEWLGDDPDCVAPVLQDHRNCAKIKNIFVLHGKHKLFSKVVPSIVAMAKRSSSVATSLVALGVLPDILNVVAEERTPFARLTLLKLMLALYENATIVAPPQQITPASIPPQTPRASQLAIPAVEQIAMTDPSDMVRGVATEILAFFKKRAESTAPSSSQIDSRHLFPLFGRH